MHSKVLVTKGKKGNKQRKTTAQNQGIEREWSKQKGGAAQMKGAGKQLQPKIEWEEKTVNTARQLKPFCTQKTEAGMQRPLCSVGEPVLERKKKEKETGKVGPQNQVPTEATWQGLESQPVRALVRHYLGYSHWLRRHAHSMVGRTALLLGSCINGGRKLRSMNSSFSSFCLPQL